MLVRRTLEWTSNLQIYTPATRLLEVIVSSVEDALEAERGGAGRLEIVRNLELGGLTPSFETVQEICQRVALPVRVMLRCSESHIPGPHEVEMLSRQAEALAALGVDGVVLGFLREHHVDVVRNTPSSESCPKAESDVSSGFR